MKTLEEAAATITCAGGFDGYREIINGMTNEINVLRAAISIISLPNITMIDAALKGIAIGVCIGIEMERQ